MATDKYTKPLDIKTVLPINTSESSPIDVNFFPTHATGTKGKLGMTLCPGRNSIGRTGDYQRDLRADLTRLRDVHGAKVLVCTIERHEFRSQKIEAYFEIAKELGIDVLWYPVVDGSTPRHIGKFRKLVREMVRRMRYGDNVVVHCKAGLGRTGTFAACVLTRLGYSPSAAIEATRATRKNTIEHNHQEGFVKTFGGKRPAYANGDFKVCVDGITPPPYTPLPAAPPFPEEPAPKTDRTGQLSFDKPTLDGWRKRY